jgi:tRNA dimethylallyltransferase
MCPKHLIIIAGPTAVGKTAVAINIARALQTEIINADSRQVYKEMVIGTAAPTAEEKTLVKHHFTGHRSIYEPYNASMFEQDAIAFLESWFKHHDVMVMAGGSGLYMDAVCRGIDDLPTVDPAIRTEIHQIFRNEGLEGIRTRLSKADPEYYDRVDLNNPQRIMKALEIYEMTGKPYTSLLTGQSKTRIFQTLKIGLNIPRNELHNRINNRVDLMMELGLLEEARNLHPYAHLNALNTVGYKELFGYFDGMMPLEKAVEKIKDHTRQYARRQITWFGRDKELTWFHPEETHKALAYIKERI